MEDRGGWNLRVHFLLLAPEGSGRKHPDAYDIPGLGYLDAYLCRAKIRVQDRPDVADPALKYPVGIGIQADIGASRPCEYLPSRSRTRRTQSRRATYPKS